MNNEILKYLRDSFAKLLDEYGFVKSDEINDEESYSVEYRSNIFVIKLEKYRREFYVGLYKPGNSKKVVDLFNLLSYLNKISSNTPQSNYFEEEKDMNECYKKQLNYLSNTIYSNYVAINDFFKSENCEMRLQDIDLFMQKKYPELFKRL